jgi:DNA-binding winged helix-turn-helix (wHTH) protein
MKVTFWGYCLDLGTRQLLRRRNRCASLAEGIDLLQVFVDNRTRAVSKADLHARLWPGTFVTDANLAVLVAVLRSALHDRPRAPKFVRTVHRFGYAFCGEIAGAVDVSAPTRTVGLCGVAVKSRCTRATTSSAAIQAPPCVSTSPASRGVTPASSYQGRARSSKISRARTERFSGTSASRELPASDLDELQVGSVRLTVRILSGGSPTKTEGDR